MAGISPEFSKRKGLYQSRVKKDESAVKSVMAAVESMINPFSHDSDELVCLSSGVVATDRVQMDLLCAEKAGEDALERYIKDRLNHYVDKVTKLSEGQVGSSTKQLKPQPDIFAPLTPYFSRLKTFADQLVSKKAKMTGGKEVIVKNERNLFSRLLAIGQHQNVDLRSILSHSLAPVSLPLASADGSLAKNVKSQLLAFIEEKCTGHLREAVPVDAAIIVDAGALIHSIKPVPSMFGELANTIFSVLMHYAKRYKSSRVDFVVDLYPDLSIKNVERTRRAVGGCQVIQIYGKKQKTPR